MSETGGFEQRCKVLIAGVLALGVTGCFPVMTPPVKADVGYAKRLGGDSGYRFSAGMDVASLIPNPEFPLHAGGGYVQTSTVYGKSRTPIHGVYLEAGPRVTGGKWWRVMAGPRFEGYFAPRGPDFAWAGLFRGELEIFSPSYGTDAPKDPAVTPDPGPSSDPPPDPDPSDPQPVARLGRRFIRPKPISGSWFGIAYGMAAIGVYVEGGYQHLPNEPGLPLLGGGALLRIPASAGVACCAWDWLPKK